MRRLRNPVTQLAVAFLVCILMLLLAPVAAAKESIHQQRKRYEMLLGVASKEIQKKYYDPSLRGLDWKKLTEEARERIDRAQSEGEMSDAIVKLVGALHDPHTAFLAQSERGVVGDITMSIAPAYRTGFFFAIPGRSWQRSGLGFAAKAYGDEIRIYYLERGSVAETVGLELGDRIVALNNSAAVRETFDDMMFFYQAVRPQSELQVTVVRDGQGPLTMTLMPDVTGSGGLDWQREAFGLEAPFVATCWARRLDDGIGYLRWKMPPGVQADLYPGRLSKMLPLPALIIDLRGNQGGSLSALALFEGYFEREAVTLGYVRRRTKIEPIKGRPDRRVFDGPLFILIDSQTASSAELLARHLQREHRAVVVGDRSRGDAAEAHFFQERIGLLLCELEIDVGHLTLPGGGELEHHGVTPDELCIPSGQDLHDYRDVCLERAIALARRALKLPPLAPEPVRPPEPEKSEDEP